MFDAQISCNYLLAMTELEALAERLQKELIELQELQKMPAEQSAMPKLWLVNRVSLIAVELNDKHSIYIESLDRIGGPRSSEILQDAIHQLERHIRERSAPVAGRK